MRHLRFRWPFIFGLLLALVASTASSVAQADVIATWTFESTTISHTGSTYPVSSTIAPEIGVGEAKGQASGFSGWSNQVGNGSSKAFSATFMGPSNYFQFKVSTVGFEDIIVSWDQRFQTSGSVPFDLQWSTDGTSFTTFTSYNATAQAWNSSTAVVASQFLQNLSAITAINDVANLYFRLTYTGGPTADFISVDNFSVQATAISTSEVPEPATWGMMVLGLTVLVPILRRRRR